MLSRFWIGVAFGGAAMLPAIVGFGLNWFGDWVVATSWVYVPVVCVTGYRWGFPAVSGVLTCMFVGFFASYAVIQPTDRGTGDAGLDFIIFVTPVVLVPIIGLVVAADVGPGRESYAPWSPEVPGGEVPPAGGGAPSDGSDPPQPGAA
jgi:hypothetical protein